MKKFLRQFAGREANPYVQFVKYAVAGAAATAVDVFVFSLVAILVFPALNAGDPLARLLGLHIAPLDESVRSAHYVWSKVISFLFSNFAAYIINVRWVFTPGRHSRTKELTLFYGISGTSFAIGTGLGWLLIKKAGLPTSYAYGANGVASLLINYAGRKFIIFKRPA
ncbi:MAG: GtrA family protein [Elusimicrobiota bacterium]